MSWWRTESWQLTQTRTVLIGMRISQYICYYWRPSLSIGLAMMFLLETCFWPSYCQISTDLDKNLHTPIVVWNTLVGRLRPRSANGWLQAKPKRLFFVILVAHPKSYTETTDRRDFGGKSSEWRWRVLSWKIPEFCSMGRARSIKQHFSRF